MSVRRQGFTLIEMLMVMTLGLMALGTVATIMHTLLKLDRAGRQRAADASNMTRLAGRIRSDAHASTKAQAVKGGADLIGLDGLVARYRPSKSGIERTTESADGKVTSRDLMRLPEGSKAEIRIDAPAKGVPMLVLTVEKGAGRATRVLPRIERIEAALGRDLRFVHSEEAPR